MDYVDEQLIKANLNSLLYSLSASLETEQFKLTKVSELVLDVFASGNKVLICGNGGSAADSQHLAAEFVSSFQNGLSRRALPAIALTTDTSIITAYSNDFEYDGIFARQIEALGKPGDLLIVFSTSGKSRNCLRAIEVASKKQLKIVTFSRSNSKIAKDSDISIEVMSEDTQRIQEVHMFFYHTICELIETKLIRSEEGIK
jgi:D-sedoheptulose 7-phosphate isomerase